jgi:hypothetical protein
MGETVEQKNQKARGKKGGVKNSVLLSNERKED